MAANLIDRVIEAVAPVHASRRAKARAQMQVMNALGDMLPNVQASEGPAPDVGDGSSSYGGGSRSLRWWRPGARDAVTDTLRALTMQRGASRELARVNPIAAGAIQTNVDRIVGTGLALVAQPNRGVLGWDEEQTREWKRIVQTEFSLWADSTDCDLEGEQNFYEKQALTLRSMKESGDCFTMLPDAPAATSTQPYRLRLQTLEADRVGNPNNSTDTATECGGIRRSPLNRAIKSCYVYDGHPGSLLPGRASLYTGQWVDCIGPSGRRRLLHHFQQLRPEQPRGVPYLAPIIDLIKQLGRYTEAEIQAAVVSAFFTVFIETEGSGNPAPVFSGLPQTTDAAGTATVQMGPGAAIGLAKGEKASFADPSRPNTAFDGFVLAILQQIGMGLGIPYELLIKRFNASYSASKAALLDAWQFFRGQRAWLARSFCQPIYECWMAEAVAIGRIAAPGFFTDPLMRWAYTRAAWHGDSQGSINPKDEVAAYTSAIDARIMTRERAEWELFGTDWYETFDSKAAEQEMLAEADLLPVPKAGAAAQAMPSAAPAAEPSDPESEPGSSAEPEDQAAVA